MDNIEASSVNEKANQGIKSTKRQNNSIQNNSIQNNKKTPVNKHGENKRNEIYMTEDLNNENNENSKTNNKKDSVSNSNTANRTGNRTGNRTSNRSRRKNKDKSKESVSSNVNDALTGNNTNNTTNNTNNTGKINEINISSKVKIIPLGGLDRIGMNITAFEYEDSIIVVDCGLAFPDEDMLGVDLVIPDVTYLKNNRDKVKGFVITHGHEDHVGALPFILKDINVPVYATKLTIGLIDLKLKEYGMLKTTKRKVVKHGNSVNLGAFRIEFIKTNHSIADASALAIYSPAGIIVHTGDFKIDYTPLFGDSIDLQRFGEIGKKGVLALLCDSTNAGRPGFTPSEEMVARTFENLFTENKNHRIIVATFASNVDRVQQIINTAYKFKRKVILQGRSMVNVIEVASELGYIKIPENTLVDVDQMKNYPDDQLVFITTGSQGEAMAALSRMADSTHKKVTIKPGDTIIFSSTPIPGNEKAVSKVINELSMKGANVIFQDTHVSGHACQEEIKLIYSLLRPKYAVPVHGEFRHRMAQAELVKGIGIPEENIFIIKSGNVLELSEEKGRIADNVQAKDIFVDGLGIGDVGSTVIKDRQYLSENGIIIVALTMTKGTNQVLAGPEIITRGFVYVKESEELIVEAERIVNAALDRCANKNITDWNKLKNSIRDDLNDYLWKKLKRSPLILPILLEA